MKEKASVEPILLTLPEAARRVGIGVRQLRLARDRGQLLIYRVGTWPRVRWSDVCAWLERHREQPTEHVREHGEQIRPLRAEPPEDGSPGP